MTQIGPGHVTNGKYSVSTVPADFRWVNFGLGFMTRVSVGSDAYTRGLFRFIFNSY